MKTKSTLLQNVLKTVLSIVATVFVLVGHAQSTPGGSGNGQQMTFRNASYINSTHAAGTDGAQYRFQSVSNNVDAIVTINGRSSSLVTLSNIDVSDIGFDYAFQPQVNYNGGSVSGATSWWMEFGIAFVTKGTTNPITVSTVNPTALDIDGDGSKLHEWDSFYHPGSYTLESPTQISVTNLVQTILGLLTNVGKTFEGTLTDHNGIDTTATDLMTTMNYSNVSSITYRAGATTTGASTKTERNYSVFFKNFTYNAPVTLPIKLVSFAAILDKNNKVDLTWTTASEMNVSHFTIEKSTDAVNYSDAGLVFALGNTTEDANYAFTDNLDASQTGVVYYRLCSVDNDGKMQYSDVRIIRLGSKSTDAALSIITYPNPASNEVRITIPASWQNKNVTYALFNSNGQVAKQSASASASQTETMDISNLTPGFYIVRVNCNGVSAQQKIVKQ